MALSATITAAQQRYIDWQAATRAKGGTPTRMPNGTNKGDLAERYGTAAPYRYVLAPLAVRFDDRATATGLQIDKALGTLVNVRDTTKSATAEVVRTIAAVPRATIGAVLGVPPWVVTLGIVAAGAYVLYSFVPTLSRARGGR